MWRHRDFNFVSFSRVTNVPLPIVSPTIGNDKNILNKTVKPNKRKSKQNRKRPTASSCSEAFPGSLLPQKIGPQTLPSNSAGEPLCAKQLLPPGQLRRPLCLPQGPRSPVMALSAPPPRCDGPATILMGLQACASGTCSVVTGAVSPALPSAQYLLRKH